MPSSTRSSGSHREPEGSVSSARSRFRPKAARPASRVEPFLPGGALRSSLLFVACLCLSLSSCSRAVRKEPPPPPAPPVAGVPEPTPPSPAKPAGPKQPSRPASEQPRIEEPPEIAVTPPKPPYEGPTGVFEARKYRSPEGQELPYRLFTPENYDPSQKYPLVVFLHGASARGSDNQKQLGGAGQYGVSPWISAETQSNHPAFVLAPQANRFDSRWVRQWRANPARKSNDKEPLELVMDLIDSLGLEFSIDTNRLYLTGLSMGGFGTWIGISRYPDKFAAAIPICGGGDPSYIGATTTKVWAFHGSSDRAVPARRSREMIAALRKAGADVRYTEYPGVDHNVWKYAYQEPELVDWLFEQRRNPVGLSKAQQHPAEAAQ